MFVKSLDVKGYRPEKCKYSRIDFDNITILELSSWVFPPSLLLPISCLK